MLDNLLADNRIAEAEEYLSVFKTLPSANSVMIDIYNVYILIGKHRVEEAEELMSELNNKYADNPDFLFEAAQYYARECKYDRALEYYNRSWSASKKPRYTDAMFAVASINKVLGDKEATINALNTILTCLKEEWGYSKDDKPYIDVMREMENAKYL